MTRVPHAPNPELDQRLADLRDDPKRPDFAPVADALCDARRHREAEEIARQGLEHHPDDVDGQRVLGRALLGRGQLQDAQALLLGILKEHKQDAGSMLLMGELLLQKSDPGRARTMLTHAARILGDDHEQLQRLQGFLGEVTGEVLPLGRRKAPACKPLGPLIGGKGSILNVEQDDADPLDAPERVVTSRRAKAGPAAKWAWTAIGLLMLAGAGVTGVRMHGKAATVRAAVDVARKASHEGSLAAYRRAHRRLKAALDEDPTSPDLKSWLAKIEARMALEYLVDSKRVPASIFAAEKVHRQLSKNPPGTFRRWQVALGLTYRSPSWGREQIVEARAIQQILQGVQPGPLARQVRRRTVAQLDEALRAHPTSTDLRYIRGLARLANGDPAGAKTDLEAVVGKDKDHVPAQLALAGLLLERGQVVDAQERYNRVIGVNPQSLRARLGLVLSRLVRGTEHTQAARDLEAIQPGKDTPRLLRGWYRLARAWLAYGQGHLKEAYGAVRDAGRSLLPEPQWLSWYIRLSLLLGDVNRARRPLHRGLAVLRSGRDPLVRAFALEIRLMDGLPKAVRSDAEALLKTTRPGSVAAKRLGLIRARALLYEGRYPESAQRFAALAKATPEASDRDLVTLYGLVASELARRATGIAPPPSDQPTKKGAPKAAPAPVTAAETKATFGRLDRGATGPVVAYARARLATSVAQRRTQLERARRYHRDAAPAGAWLAELVIADGDVARGRRLLNAAFALAPSYFPALRTRARMRRALGRPAEALADLTTLCYAGAHIVIPANLLARLRYAARWSARLTRLDRTTVCPSPLVTPADLLLRAELYLEQNQANTLDLARLYIALGEAAGGSPLHAAVLRAQADLSAVTEPAGHKALLAKLKALAKTHAGASRYAPYLRTLGATRRAARDIKGAAEAYTKAIALDPKDIRTLSALAWVELGRGRQAEAVAAFRKAVAEARRQKADPTTIRAPLHYALGKSLMAAGKTQDLKAAQAAFEAAARLDPQLLQALVEQARLAILRRSPAQARRKLDEVLRYDAGHPDALLLLIRLLGKGSAADKKRIPALLVKLVQTARFEAQQGRPGEARYWLELILKNVRKDHPGASLALATLLASSKADRARVRALLDVVAKSGSPKQKAQAEALRGRLTKTPAPAMTP